MKFSSKYLAPVGIFLFVYIVWRIGLEKMLQTITNINILYFIIAILLMFLSIIFKVKKWQEIINVHCNISLLDTTYLWLIGLFFATITPGRLGDLAKAFYLKDRLSFGRSFSTVLLERIIDLAVLFMLGAFGIFLTVYLFAPALSTSIILFAFTALGLILLYLLTKRNFVKILSKPIYNLMIPEKYKEKLTAGFEDTYNGVKKVKDNKKKLFLIFSLSLLSWFFAFSSAFFIAKSVGVEIGFIYLVAFMPLSTIVELIPVTMSGLGTREATLIFFFSFLGISASSTVVFSLLYLIMGWVFAFIGWLFWLRRPLKLSF